MISPFLEESRVQWLGFWECDWGGVGTSTPLERRCVRQRGTQRGVLPCHAIHPATCRARRIHPKDTENEWVCSLVSVMMSVIQFFTNATLQPISMYDQQLRVAACC